MFRIRKTLTTIFIFFSAVYLLFSCKNYHRNKSFSEVSNSSVRKGEKLAKKYCQSCHMLPASDLLDAKTWDEGVLPIMGPYLGIFKHNFQKYVYAKNDPNLGSNFYPAQPLLTSEEWQSIIDYYTATSPDSLPEQNQQTVIQSDLKLFEVEKPAFTYNSPAIPFVKINQDSLHTLVVCDVVRKNIYSFNKKLQLVDSLQTNGTIVDIDFDKTKMVACNIGLLNPNNGRFGKAEIINIEGGKMKTDMVPLFDSLRRPVHLTSADLNNDNRTDYIICEFGNFIGELSWMENLENNQFRKHVLREYPGAIKAYVKDYNHDGLLDIWVLFAQGEEGIFLFTNKGGGQFEQKEVLRFPSVYGSSFFELTDFNHDGHDDIVYTCGDNADYSMVLKPYHGVYVFINNGNNQFTKAFFYHINGCYKAIARDYDNDGDLDIATISFFADYTHRPEEGFVYLNNKGDFSFEAFTIPEAVTGRWLTMDAGDVDGDGKIDLVLGSFSIRPTMMQTSIDWTAGPTFLFLRNTGVQ